MNGDRGPDALIEFSYVAATGSSTTGTTPVASPTVTYVYGVGTAPPTVPLGQSIVLTAAEEAAAPIAIQVEMVNLGSTGTTVSTAPATTSGTGGPPLVLDPSRQHRFTTTTPTTTGTTTTASGGDTVHNASRQHRFDHRPPRPPPQPRPRGAPRRRR